MSHDAVVTMPRARNNTGSESGFVELYYSKVKIRPNKMNQCLEEQGISAVARKLLRIQAGCYQRETTPLLMQHGTP